MRTASTIVALVLALTACGSTGEGPVGLAGAASPSPTDPPGSTPSSSPTSTPDTEQGHVEAARVAYLAYVDAMNTLAQDGFADPAPVAALLWGDPTYRSAVMDDVRDKHARGIVQTGEQVVADIELGKYVADPSGTGQERVVLDVCVDDAGFDQHDPSGASILVEDGVDRRPATVTLAHQPEDRWTVSTVEWHPGQAC